MPQNDILLMISIFLSIISIVIMIIVLKNSKNNKSNNSLEQKLDDINKNMGDEFHRIRVENQNSNKEIREDVKKSLRLLSEERLSPREVKTCVFVIFFALKSRQKKWQTCKDSNLNKMNQNHLCYRYTTGLRNVYNIPLIFCVCKSVYEKII